MHFHFSACTKCSARTQCTCVIEPLTNSSTLNYGSPINHYESLAASGVQHHQNYSHSHSVYNTIENVNPKCEPTALLTVNHQHITYNYPIYHAPAAPVVTTNPSVNSSPKSSTDHHTCSTVSPATASHAAHYPAPEESAKAAYHHYHPTAATGYSGTESSLCYNNNCETLNYNTSIPGSYDYDLHARHHLSSAHHTTSHNQHATSEPAEYINYSDLKCPTARQPSAAAMAGSEIVSNEPEFINYSELKHFPHIMDTSGPQDSKPTKLNTSEETSLYTDPYESCYYSSGRATKVEKSKEKFMDHTIPSTYSYDTVNHHHYNHGASGNYFANATTASTSNTYPGVVTNYYDTATTGGASAATNSLHHHQLPSQPQATYDYTGSSAAAYASAYSYDQMSSSRSGSLTGGSGAVPCHTYAH